LILKDCKFVPDLIFNLLSLTQAIEKGFQLSNDGLKLILSNKILKIVLDQVIKNANGILIGVYMEPILASMNLVTTKTNKSININALHGILGHPSEQFVRTTAKMFDWKIIGEFIDCEACAIAKAKQKNLPKSNYNKSTIPGERLYIDISSVNQPSFGSSKYWLLIVDEFSKMKWSFFLKTKDESTGKTLRSEFNKTTKYLQCDNAGENLNLQAECKQQEMGIFFEFTAPNTPQQNGVVERAFATLYGRIRAMLNSSNLKQSTAVGLWAECAATATFLDNILVHQESKKCPFESFFDKKPKLPEEMYPFGTVCIITNREKIKSKLQDRGEKCIFVGYASDHASDVYRFYKPTTKKIILSRDVKWLKKIDHDIFNDEKDTPDYATGREEEKVENEKIKNNEINPKQKKVWNQLKKLNTFFNPTIDGLINFNLMSAVESDYSEPQTFEQAWHHSNDDEKINWREAIKKEYLSMVEKKVWEIKDKSDVPEDRRLLGTKWVFKKKSSGIFRARLVALGYNQVPGVDYSANFSPVVNEVTMRIILLLKLKNDWDMQLIDVETAFLYGELEEEIYLHIPSGYNEVFGKIDSEKCLILKKSLYGLVQAARQWWKKLAQQLQDLKYKMSDSDPCLFFRTNGKESLILCIYVDDILCIGNKKEIDCGIQELQKYYNIKRTMEVREYVGCTILRKEEDKNKLFLCQPELINRLVREFSEEINNAKIPETPFSPGQVIIRPKSDNEKIEERKQKLFRSGVGMLLYLVKYSRPDIANGVRELSKVMDGATPAHYKCLLRMIHFVIVTRNNCLVLQGNSSEETPKWSIKGYSDSDYAGDKDTRTSVTGFIIYINNNPISWRSRGQKSVTLSSSEAEYVALSEVCAEILFISYVLNFLGIPTMYPIDVMVDNVGAIFLATNRSVSQRTRHIDVRYHFVRNYIEDNIIKINFVRSENNVADIFTKNVRQETFFRHSEKLFG
jgi:hypothetical protein